jgi:hypothetical protein
LWRRPRPKLGCGAKERRRRRRRRRRSAGNNIWTYEKGRYQQNVEYYIMRTFIICTLPHTLLLLSLAPQPSLGLGLLLKIQLNFLEASEKCSFLQGRVVRPMPNPHPGGPSLCIYIPQKQGGYPF